MRETLRIWLDGTEAYVFQVILGQRQGKIATIIRGFLHVMSDVYSAIIKARRFLYNVFIPRVNQPFPQKRFPFWKVLILALIISALAGIVLAILIPTLRS